MTINLTPLGLGENEGKVYLLLVKTGRMTAKDVSDKTGMKSTTVYDNLKVLVEKGMIAEIPVEKGVKQYEAYPPRKLKSVFEQQKKEADELISTFEAKYTPPKHVKSKEDFLNSIADFVDTERFHLELGNLALERDTQVSIPTKTGKNLTLVVH